MAKSSDMDEQTYRHVFSKAVRLCVDLMIVSGGGVLLGRRVHKPFQEMYALPGGRLLFGESIKDAIARKAKEEVGTAVSDIKLQGVLEFPEEIATSNRHSISLLYSCKADRLPVLSNKLTFDDISYSDLIKPNLIIPVHAAAIRKFYNA